MKLLTLEQAKELMTSYRILLVRDGAFPLLNLDLGLEYAEFDQFSVNPEFEEMVVGTKKFIEESCDFLVAVGGGSTLDVAKGIKYLLERDIPLLAMPTTAGTGSEATHFAVAYRKGQKESLAHPTLVPNYVVLESNFLKTLPIYQRRCTFLDALCQGIESLWSKKRTQESAGYAKEAIYLLMANAEAYLSENSLCDDSVYEKIMYGAHLAGKAINLTTTTAPHAMSYQLTKKYGIPHGHAVALCLPHCWEQMGGQAEIAQLLGYETSSEAIQFLKRFLTAQNIVPPAQAVYEDIDYLVESVNVKRLSNHPVTLMETELHLLYQKVLNTSSDTLKV